MRCRRDKRQGEGSSCETKCGREDAIKPRERMHRYRRRLESCHARYRTNIRAECQAMTSRSSLGNTRGTCRSIGTPVAPNCREIVNCRQRKLAEGRGNLRAGAAKQRHENRGASKIMESLESQRRLVVLPSRVRATSPQSLECKTAREAPIANERSRRDVRAGILTPKTVSSCMSLLWVVMWHRVPSGERSTATGKTSARMHRCQC
ncbi:hypothetical protein C8R45DRAFT_973490 [Mycena sanguinolenta]|nr:hypothetical protein C8R45DRAFT_973490 [Mycena sanguinolenta]